MILIELQTLASENRVDLLKYILDQKEGLKLDLESKNVNGETALHTAARNGCNEAVKMLIDSGANLDARTNNSMTPLHLAVSYAMQSGKNSVVKTLVEYKADRWAADNKGMTPLNYLLASLKNQELLRLLCQDNVACQTNNYMGQIVNASQNNVNQINKKMRLENLEETKMEEFEDELSKIVGLRDLKTQFKKWAKGMLLDEKRRAMGINLGPRKQPHMVFLGNPGTGKTTVARILGKLLQSVGVLSSDKVIEVQRTDLVGEYMGRTGPKTRKKIEEAMGGILFVDEAYRLVPVRSQGHSQDLGVEALEEIMSVLEDGKIVVIFAGYTEPMKRVFSSNAGFTRRVTHFYQFDDFTCKDLADMLILKMSKQSEKSRLYGFKLHPLCTYDDVLGVIEKNSTEKMRNKMNGGLVDHMLNNARENLDSRMNFDAKFDELVTITLSDLEVGLQMLSQQVNID
ncbi:hypothetical protein ABFX02_10G106800 [Erythranthe guttata]